MSDVNIERDYFENKQYQSRDGRTVQIISRNGPDKNHPVIVAYEILDGDGKSSGGWTYDSVTNEGHEFHICSDEFENPNDIVEVPPASPRFTINHTFTFTGTKEQVDYVYSQIAELSEIENSVASVEVVSA